jgi:acyl transferase domain-containing protein
MSLTYRAEGFAATVIKRLDNATADKDHIYFIITGSSINSNGRGIILTAPEGDMQEEIIKQAYSLANRKLSDAFFVELHVTGTPTGDPIEVNAVGKIFSANRRRGDFLRYVSITLA